MGRVAHEIKNPLNGVALNLHVIRSRVARDADTAALRPFVDAAQTDLEVLVVRLDALLALARPASPPIDLYATARSLGVLYAAVLARQGEGGSVALTLRPAPDAPAETSACAAAVRFTIASVFEAVVGDGEHERRVECGVTFVDGEPAVVVQRMSAEALGLGMPGVDGVRDAARTMGARVIVSTESITLIFPPHGGPGVA